MKSRLVIAAAILLGSASLVAAQSNIPRIADDSQQASYGPVPGAVIPAPVTSPAAVSNRLGDDSGQASYARDTGTSAFASSPAPAPARTGGGDGRFDPDNQRGYAR